MSVRRSSLVEWKRNASFRAAETRWQWRAVRDHSFDIRGEM